MEFLVATRKFNPRAGDPAVYIPLQAEENMARLMEGSEEEQLEGVQALDFITGSIPDTNTKSITMSCSYKPLTSYFHRFARLSIPTASRVKCLRQCSS